MAEAASIKTAVETKQDRRARILHQARVLIGRDGFEGLSVRKLAAAAGVTVPTIYNLIGGKDVLLLELIGGFVTMIEDRLALIDEDHPLDIAEAVVIEATRLIGEDETYFRSAHVALEHMYRTGGDGSTAAKIGPRSQNMQRNAVRLAQQQGLLRGDISAEVLSDRIFANYREASRRWTLKRCTLAQFRKEALEGVYLYFLADASEAYRPVLLERLRVLDDAS